MSKSRKKSKNQLFGSPLFVLSCGLDFTKKSACFPPVRFRGGLISMVSALVQAYWLFI